MWMWTQRQTQGSLKAVAESNQLGLLEQNVDHHKLESTTSMCPSEIGHKFEKPCVSVYSELLKEIRK